jgi:hypothetical protein
MRSRMHASVCRSLGTHLTKNVTDQLPITLLDPASSSAPSIGNFTDGGDVNPRVRRAGALTETALRQQVSAWFFDADAAFIKYGDMGDWDVSRVSNFLGLFAKCRQQESNLFTANLSKWDTSSGTNMDQMFAGCSEFESDLKDWDVRGARFLFVIGGVLKDAFGQAHVWIAHVLRLEARKRVDPKTHFLHVLTILSHLHCFALRSQR